jgi:hypothetical protein
LAAIALAACAQSPLNERSGRSLLPAETAGNATVDFLFPEQVTAPAGKPTTVALHFRVRDGLHINSHTPKEEFLIPTVLTFPEDAGVRLEGAVYPAGSDFVFPLDPKEKLSVYQGEFVIQARIVVAPGDHLVQAKLRYQACDDNACMPPRTLTAAIEVLGKQGTRESGNRVQ